MNRTSSRSRSSLHRHLVAFLGWKAESIEARRLRGWLARHLLLERGWNGRVEAAVSELPESARAFNRRAELLALELAAHFGIEDANRLADLLPLHRVDEDTGGFHRVRLCGELFDPRLDSSRATAS